MREPAMERLDRHALVLAIWLAFGLVALILFRTGVTHVRWTFVAAGFAAILAGFVGHVIVNAVLGTFFTAREVALGLVFYLCGLLGLAFASLLSPAFRAQQFLPFSLGMIVLFVSVIFYMTTHFGVRRAFESFDVIRQFRQ